MKRRASLRAAIALLAALALALPAEGKLIGENLLFEMPAGYKISREENNAKRWRREMVPAEQSAEKWTTRIIVQVLHRRGDMAPAAYEAQVRTNLLETCPSAEYHPIRDGFERGYRFSFWLLYCDLNTATGSPEYTYFKALQGRDALYVIQKTFSRRLERWQIPQVARLLFDAHLCDNRVSYQVCPNDR